MNDQLAVLSVTAAAIGMLHAALGPDHYVPFIVMAHARGWSVPRMLAITSVCGAGHLLGSLMLGVAGIGLGWTVGQIEWFEGLRGDVAGWLMIGFGLAYTAWGVRRAARNRPHTHWHSHGDGTLHKHAHVHHEEHLHLHEQRSSPRGAASDSSATFAPWVVFTVLVLGPCEPLIPILMYPAATGSWLSVAIVTLIFGAVTLMTMLGLTLAGYLGLSRLAFGRLERFSHATAGIAIIACGLAVKLGL